MTRPLSFGNDLIRGGCQLDFRHVFARALSSWLLHSFSVPNWLICMHQRVRLTVFWHRFGDLAVRWLPMSPAA
jgi:hypothetical protein